MRREGSAFSGLGVVMLKELSDHLTSVRMRVLEWLVVLVALAALYGAIQQIKDTTAEDPFLFLRLFTTSRDPLPSFVSFISFLVPLMAIGLGFDAVNGEYNRRTLSRILVAADLPGRAAVRKIPRRLDDACDQPDHAVAAGHRARPAADRHSARRRRDRPQLPVPPGDDHLCRRLAGAGAVVLDRVPLGRDRSACHSRPVAVHHLHMAGACRRGRANHRAARSAIHRAGFADAGDGADWSRSWRGCRHRLCLPKSVVALLDPTTRSLGPIYLSQLQGAVLGAPLPMAESMLIAWPQTVGMIAGAILLFVIGYVIFQRQEVRA